MEKDFASVKDQLTKVFQRLGAAEKKQKADKKEIESLQTEVKLANEGMRVASQTVDAAQSLLQSLEFKLLEKVDAAFKKAHTASETADQLQCSFQNLQSEIAKRGSSPDNQLQIPATKPASVKLVDEISCFFHKENQRCCKIEQRLLNLKAILKQERLDKSLATSQPLDLEDLAFSKMAKEKVSKKMRPQEEEKLFNRNGRKRSKLYLMNVINGVAK